MNKKFLVLLMVVLCSSILLAQTGVTYGVAPKSKALKSDVLNSMHDLVTGAALPGWGGGTSANPDVITGSSGSPCYVCHIVHKTGAKPATGSLGIGTLLWNPKMSSFGSYGTYGSEFATAISLSPTDLGTASAVTNSNLCLSCHDGSVALGTYYQTGFWGGPGNKITANNQLQDMTESHPINFQYAGQAFADDTYVKKPASVNSVDADGNIPLYAGKMQCGTCHDVHAGKSYFERPFTAGKNDTANRGEMCTYCHL